MAELSQMDLLLEAERRGIVPEEKQGLLDEARRRGLIDALPAASGAPTPEQPPRSISQAFGERRFGDFVKERIRMLFESPQFRRNVAEKGLEGLSEVVTVGGALLAGPLARAGRTSLMLAEPLVSAGAEAVGQMISGEREPMDLLLAGAYPAALRGAFTLGVKGVRKLPGAAAGIHQEAVQRGRELIQRLRPQDLESMRALAKSFDDMRVPLDRMRATIAVQAREARKLAPALQPKESLVLGQQLEKLMKSMDDEALPLRSVLDNLQEMGARIGELRRASERSPGLVKGVTRILENYRGLYRTALQGLEDLGDDVPDVLRSYRKALRMNFGADDLEKILESPAIMTERQIDGLVSLNGRKMKIAWEKAKDSQFLQESFTPGQRAEITEFMNAIVKLPPLPSPRGVNVGSALVLGRTAGVGGAVQYLTGDPALAGGAAALAATAPPIIARAMMTRAGRALVIKSLRADGGLYPKTIEALAAISRQALTRPSHKEAPMPSAGIPQQTPPASLTVQRFAP